LNCHPASSSYRVGIDIGGTFTDVVVVTPEGSVLPIKVSSTPPDYSRAVIDGLRRLMEQHAISPLEIEELIHGTTIATNAILEKQGARTALITTSGFRDVLEIRRVRMPQLYNIQWRKPEPLVPRYLRFEVNERIDAHGDVLVPLDESSLDSIADDLRREDVEAVAICLINAYANPIHEQQIAAAIRERRPGLQLSVSTDITRELKEFERTSTTVIDAYVKPVVDRYLAALQSDVRQTGVQARLLVMQSNGAVMSVDNARKQPCFLIESGPAAGVVAGRALAERVGEPNLITFDMGGTTAKAALIEHGEMGQTDEYEVGSGITVGTRLMKGDGYLLRIPAVDLAEVGAGGGSIAWVDAGGRLQVGPRSAGALPGPACYGQGGHEPTITDANVMLGYIDPEQFANKNVHIDPDLASQAMERLAAQLGLSTLDTALAVHVVGNARMSRPIRAVTVERGLDVRDFTLLAFGGSGPIHACTLASELGIRRILIPPLAGLFSAVGLCLANAGHHFVRTSRHRLDRLASDELLDSVNELEREASQRLGGMDYTDGTIDYQVLADMRYSGQAFNLTVDLTDMLLTGDGLLERMATEFALQHERTYGHRAEEDPIEIINLRVRASIATNDVWPTAVSSSDAASSGQQTRRMLFQREAGMVETPIITRAMLRSPVNGPLAIAEDDTTIIVPPDWRASLDDLGNVRLDRMGQGR
jgi:N-methylhydantoinase A